MEVPEVQVVDVIAQVSVPTVEIVQKQVAIYETQVVEKVVEVPHVLREEIPVDVPQIQTAEVLRQDAVAQIREVVKQIPRVSMQYRGYGGSMVETFAPATQTLQMNPLPFPSQVIPSGGYVGTQTFRGGVVGGTVVGGGVYGGGYTSGVYGGGFGRTVQGSIV